MMHLSAVFSKPAFHVQKHKGGAVKTCQFQSKSKWVHVTDKRDGLPGQTAIIWERCVTTSARHVLTAGVCYPFGYNLH